MLKIDIKENGILTVEEWINFIEYQLPTVSILKTMLEEIKRDLNNGKYANVPNLKKSKENLAESLIKIIYEEKGI